MGYKVQVHCIDCRTSYTEHTDNVAFMFCLDSKLYTMAWQCKECGVRHVTVPNTKSIKAMRVFKPEIEWSVPVPSVREDTPTDAITERMIVEFMEELEGYSSVTPKVLEFL